MPCSSIERSAARPRYDPGMRLTRVGGRAAADLRRRRAGATPSRRRDSPSTRPRRSRSSATRCSRRPGPGASYADVEAAGLAAVAPADVLPGVRELVDLVSLEVLLGDGTRLIALVDPLGPRRAGGPRRARRGRSGRGSAAAPAAHRRRTLERRRLHVANTSRRVVRGLVALPVRSGEPAARVRSGGAPPASASTSRRARPSAGRPARRREVTLVRFGGAAARAARLGRRRRREPPLPRRASGALRAVGRRSHPARRHGPLDSRRGGSPGHRRRADLGLREGHPARAWPRPARPGPRSSTRSSSARSSSIPTIGVVKADIGIKDGRVVGCRAGRATRRSATASTSSSARTRRPISGYGLIATPGAVDSHVHTVSPNLIPAALSGGVTTLISAGFDRAAGARWSARSAASRASR